MSISSSNDLHIMIQVFVICSFILLVKYEMSQLYGANLSNHPDEDKMIFKLDEKSDQKRKERQAANDVENIPMHLTIFWAAFIIQCLAIATGKGHSETIVLTALMIAYTCARILFTICYIFALQPYRTLSHVFSLFSVIGASAITVSIALQIDVDLLLSYSDSCKQVTN